MRAVVTADGDHYGKNFKIIIGNYCVGGKCYECGTQYVDCRPIYTKTVLEYTLTAPTTPGTYNCIFTVAYSPECAGTDPFVFDYKFFSYTVVGSSPSPSPSPSLPLPASTPSFLLLLLIVAIIVAIIVLLLKRF